MLLAQAESTAIYVTGGFSVVMSILAVLVSWFLARHSDQRQDQDKAVADAARQADVSNAIQQLQDEQAELKLASTNFAGVKATQDAMLRELHEFRAEVREAITKLFDLSRNPFHRCQQEALLAEQKTKLETAMAWKQQMEMEHRSVMIRLSALEEKSK